MRFRTNELTSMYHAWKEGMKEWKRVFEVNELKHLIMGKRVAVTKCLESKNEILEEVVQEYVKKLKTSKTKQHLNEEGASDDD